MIESSLVLWRGAIWVKIDFGVPWCSSSTTVFGTVSPSATLGGTAIQTLKEFNMHKFLYWVALMAFIVIETLVESLAAIGLLKLVGGTCPIWVPFLVMGCVNLFLEVPLFILFHKRVVFVLL